MAEKNFIVRNGLTVSGGVTVDSDVSISGSLTVGGVSVTAGIDSAEVRGLISGGTGITYTEGTGVIDISNTGVTAATYGDSSTIPQITVNAQGQITAVVGAGVNIPAGYGDADVDAHLVGGTGITYSAGNISITNTGVSAATYGDSSTIPVITVNAQGQITGVLGAGVNIPAGYGDVDVDAHLSGGTGISYTSGVIANTGVLSVNSVTGAVTAANLLTAIKTVDGAASGLDADLLDGQQGSYYRIDVYNAAGTLLN